MSHCQCYYMQRQTTSASVVSISLSVSSRHDLLNLLSWKMLSIQIVIWLLLFLIISINLVINICSINCFSCHKYIWNISSSVHDAEAAIWNAIIAVIFTVPGTCSNFFTHFFSNACIRFLTNEFIDINLNCSRIGTWDIYICWMYVIGWCCLLARTKPM